MRAGTVRPVLQEASAMNPRTVLALVRRYLFLSFRMKWRAIEPIYFPLISLLMWGFLTLVARGETLQFAFMMLGVQIVWNFAFQAQNNFNIFVMEDVWNECFKELMTAPITAGELLASRFIAASLRSSVTIVFLLVAAVGLFGFSVVRLDLGVFSLFLLATLIASTGIAILIDGAIIEMGQEFSFLVWSATQLFIMLSCPYYPIEAFPAVLHPLIRAAPFYWVFDGVRSHLTDPAIDVSSQLHLSLLVSVVYLIVSVPVFLYFISRARRTGKLARM